MIMKFIKLIIFRLLLAVRGIILNVSGILALTFFLGSLGILFMDEFKNVPVAGKVIAVLLVIFFTLVNWLYDYLVLCFVPEGTEITLYH